jgi:hypothetical protein
VFFNGKVTGIFVLADTYLDIKNLISATVSAMLTKDLLG